jgi:hypothetical protein
MTRKKKRKKKNQGINKKLNSVNWVREWTILTERTPLVGEVRRREIKEANKKYETRKFYKEINKLNNEKLPTQY